MGLLTLLSEFSLTKASQCFVKSVLGIIQTIFQFFLSENYRMASCSDQLKQQYEEGTVNEKLLQLMYRDLKRAS